MKKSCLFVALIVFVYFFPLNLGFSLTLDKIGVLDTSGVSYTEWWYTGSNPTFYGTADANAAVSVAVNDTDFSVTADGDGNWNYNAGFDGGDHTVSFSSGGETIAFTLHLSQGVPEDVDGTTEATVSVPDTGTTHLYLLVGSLGLIAVGWYIWDRKRALSSFESGVTKEL